MARWLHCAASHAASHSLIIFSNGLALRNRRRAMRRSYIFTLSKETIPVGFSEEVSDSSYRNDMVVFRFRIFLIVSFISVACVVSLSCSLCMVAYVLLFSSISLLFLVSIYIFFCSIMARFTLDNSIISLMVRLIMVYAMLVRNIIILSAGGRGRVNSSGTCPASRISKSRACVAAIRSASGLISMVPTSV